MVSKRAYPHRVVFTAIHLLYGTCFLWTDLKLRLAIARNGKLHLVGRTTGLVRLGHKWSEVALYVHELSSVTQMIARVTFLLLILTRLDAYTVVLSGRVLVRGCWSFPPRTWYTETLTSTRHIVPYVVYCVCSACDDYHRPRVTHRYVRQRCPDVGSKPPTPRYPAVVVYARIALLQCLSPTQLRLWARDVRPDSPKRIGSGEG